MSFQIESNHNDDKDLSEQIVIWNR